MSNKIYSNSRVKLGRHKIDNKKEIKYDIIEEEMNKIKKDILEDFEEDIIFYE